MDGLIRRLCIAATCMLALEAIATFVLPAALAQAPCDAGNPCAGTDIASQASIGPSTGANNPIDVLSGNKYQRETDLELPGELGLSFTRHYNSASTQGGALGGGWSHSYETALLRVERDATATITIVQGDGRRIEFRSFGSIDRGVQRYHSVPLGYGVIDEDVATLDSLRQSRTARATSAQPWQWAWPDGRRLTFDARGVLTRIEAPSGEWITLEYDQHARLRRVADFAGRELHLAYWDRPSDWLTPYGANDRTARGAKHRLKSLTLPDQRTIEYFYDRNGLLAEARFPDGTSKRYEYDETAGALLLARVIGRDGRVAGAYSYDASGQAISSESGGQRVGIERDLSASDGTSIVVLTSSDGSRTHYRWKQSAFGYQLLEAHGVGCAACPASNVRYTYDPRGLVVRIDRLGPMPAIVQWSEIIARDHWGRITSREREENGVRHLIERYEYASDDPLTKPTRIVRPSVAPGAFHSFDLTYNERGQPIHVVESGFAPDPRTRGFTPIRRTRTYSYYELDDGASHLVGRLKSIDGPIPGEIDRVVLFYDERGLLTRLVHSTRDEERFHYDALGRLREHIPLDGIPVALEYDAEGRASKFVRAGLSSTIVYDIVGRIRSLRDSIGQQFTFEYDHGGLTAISDSGNNRIEFELDPAGRPVARRLLNPDGTISQQSLNPIHAASVEPTEHAQPFSHALSFIRLPIFKSWTTNADALVAPALATASPRDHQQVVDERGLSSHYRFDDFGRLVSVMNPDSGEIVLEYDESSRVIARHFADGRSIHYDYDALGRVETIAADDERVVVEYGAFGKPARIAYTWGDERFQYDAAGRLALREQRIDGHTFTRAYRYDELGRLHEETRPDGTTLVYRYNASVHAKPGVLASIERKGWLRSTPIISGLNEAEDRYDRSSARYGNGLELERELDLHGRLRRFGTAGVALFDFETDSKGRIVTANDGRTRTFTHDAFGRLQRASLSGSESAELAYDAAGNARIIASSDARSLLRVDTTTNRLLARVESDGSELHYAYDPAGRTTSIGERTFDYDGFGRLKRILQSGEPIAEYTYNTFGERIRKVVYSGSARHVTYFFYDGSKLTAEADEHGQIRKQFAYVHERAVALLFGAKTYALHTDWLGTPIAATDEHQRIVWRADIDPLNRVRSQRGALRIDLRGSNQYFDAESGLHYNLHRYFDPATSRYLTPDPIGQLGGLNLYAFANGDPINFIDALGYQAIPADWGFVDRYAVFLKAGIQALPRELLDSVGAALQELLDPGVLATSAAIFAAWGISQLTPFGWAADLVIIGLGFAFMGAAIVDFAEGAIAAYRAIRDARTMQDLCDAGRDYARAVADLVLELGGGGSLLSAARRVGGDIAAQIRRVFRGNSQPPPPGPLLWTQEMAQRVSDGYGNQIRQFMAGRNHMWRTEEERARWLVFEDASESFVRAYFNPRFVINARHNNGTATPEGRNGFDLVFVSQEGRLVIVEAKSGRVTPLTAFGAGRRGERQLELNLSILRQSIEANPDIPDAMKADLFRQIESRSFETQLHLAPKSSIPAGRLDIFQDILGKPLDAIYILPEGPPARD